MITEHPEIEVRFLEIDERALSQKLKELGTEDLGEDFLEEVIFYDKELAWQAYGRKFIRIRKTKKGMFVTYKHQAEDTATGTEEIEFKVDGDIEKVTAFLDRLGYPAYRRQQKKRHTFQLGDVTIDFDTWPKVPTYVEFEGPSEEAIKTAATKVGLDWGRAVFENPRIVIKKHYGIPVETLKWFTFDRIE